MQATQKSRIEYSAHESEIFGYRIGRLTIDREFTEWDSLKAAIAESDYQYLRIRLKSPTNYVLDRLNELGKKAHLLEILRSYITVQLPGNTLENWAGDYTYVAVDASNKELFLQTFNDTYEDMPFGSYTSEEVLKKFDVATQRASISSYFYKYYSGDYPNKETFLIYHNQKDLVGCVIMDFLETESYTYYVGVRKEFRKNHILLRTINFIHRTTQERKLTYSKGSARMHNLYSQKAFDKSGMACDGYDWIYLLEV